MKRKRSGKLTTQNYRENKKLRQSSEYCSDGVGESEREEIVDLKVDEIYEGVNTDTCYSRRVKTESFPFTHERNRQTDEQYRYLKINSAAQLVRRHAAPCCRAAAAHGV